MNKNFFESQTPSSRVKAEIVSFYFPRYCRIINRSPQKKIIFLDLFSGPGLYNDGSHSTPLLIADEIARDETLREKVHLMFNDNQYINELKQNFLSKYPPGTFNYDPIFGNKTVGEDERILKFLIKKHPNKNPHPTLLFFDPWGYKGIDTVALAKFLENWGNELFLFVNIKRIHAAIENEKFDDLMTMLFPTSIDLIRQERKYQAKVHERLSLIMDNLAGEFKKLVPNGLFYTPFKFQEEDSKTTSHFIIHFTKHPRGYDLVKQTYYAFDNVGAVLDNTGTYTFDAKRMNDQPGIFVSDENIEALAEELASHFSGQTIAAREVFDQHQIWHNYAAQHYVKSLRKMVEDEQIDVNFTDNIKHRKSVLLIDDCILKFK